MKDWSKILVGDKIEFQSIENSRNAGYGTVIAVGLISQVEEGLERVLNDRMLKVRLKDQSVIVVDPYTFKLSRATSSSTKKNKKSKKELMKHFLNEELVEDQLALNKEQVNQLKKILNGE